MKHWGKRIGCMGMVFVFVLSMCGCAKKPKTYFQEVWRADTHFSEIVYEHYEREQFMPYIEAIYEMAENGGTREAFAETDDDLWAELEYVCTLVQLADLQAMKDPATEVYAEEYIYITELYQELYDEFFLALHEMSISPNSRLMTTQYSADYISWFKEYEPYTKDENDVLGYDRETALIQEYYELMAAEEPDEERIGEIFVELIALRNDQAELMGYESYGEYAYQNLYGRDYLPKDVEKIWEGVKANFVPLYCQYRDRANEQTEWLLNATELSFTSEAVLKAIEQPIKKMSEELYTAFAYMLKNELYDIRYDEKKAEIGYTLRLYSYNQPYIFNYAYNDFYDYLSVIHEFGHFANGFYTTGDFLFGISDMDICELQSQGLELLMIHDYGKIF